MKTLVILLSIIALVVPAFADQGIMMFVYPTGSLYGEAVKAGLSSVPDTWPWGTTHNPYAIVNIGLQGPTGDLLYCDVRPLVPDTYEMWYGKIWTTDPEITYDVHAGYFKSILGGPWILPQSAAKISFWQERGLNLQTVTLNNHNWGWPTILSGMQGDWNFKVTIYQSPVPEPSGLLALGTGIFALGELIRRRK